MSLSVEIDGVRYSKWFEGEVERGLGTFAHRFSFRYIVPRLESLARATIKKLNDYEVDASSVFEFGANIAIYWNDELLTTGYVDSVSQHIGQNERTWIAEGRSATGDLADCSATHKTGTWSNKSCLEIARDLCDPFGLEVVTQELDAQKFARFGIQEGETVHAALERLCKVRGLLPVTRANGGVELRRISVGYAEPYDARYAIERSIDTNIQDRYSDYILHATQVDSGNSIKDEAVPRYRPLVVVPESNTTGAQAKTRAVWEKAVRAGRSEKYRIRIPAGTAPTGYTYFPGRVFQLSDPDLAIEGPLVVDRSVLRVTDKEVMTDVEFCRPETYSLRDYPETLLSGTTKRGKAIRHKTKPGK